MTKATTAPQLSPGTVIDGNYTVGAVVRSRAGSVTYEARDLQGARVEVTVHGPECFMSPVALERGLRELRQLEKVSSSQIVRVIDAGKMQQGGIYEVHEPIRGASLADAGPLAADLVKKIVGEVANAAAAAQKVGVFHRNLGADSVVRVGEAIQVFNFAVGDPQGGVSFGAIDCIAPEQVEGRNIDERTLVYNLGALAYRILSGSPLFKSEDTGTSLLQHAASLPPENSMPAPLFAALAKDPKARPPLAKFLGDLDVIIAEFPREGTLEEHMHDPDAPKDSAAKPADAPAPASAAKAVAGPVPAAKPAVAPPPAVGPKTAASVGLPPAIGKPGAPPVAAPPAASPITPPPTFSPPTVTPPTLTPPSLSAPSLAPPPAASVTATPSAKPRTRGWTMFMEATDNEVTAAPGPGVPVAPAATATPAVATAPTPTPAPAPAPTPAPAPAPAAAPGEVKPSTRGWTMIMDEPSESDAAALALTTPAAATVPPPASPTTRGWTMLEELSDGLPAATPAAQEPAKPAAAAQPDKSAADGAPSSRGWTMFMEAELKGDEKQPESEPEPEFYDGQMTTDTGTVVAFAPSADSPNARRPEPAADLADGPEELRSFGARLREPEAPEAPTAAEPSAPTKAQSEIPTFTGNSSFDFGGLTPPVMQEPARPQSQAKQAEPPSTSLEGDGPAQGGSKTLIIGAVVVVIVVIVVVVMMSS